MLLDIVNETLVSNGGFYPAVYAATAQGGSIDMSNCNIQTGMVVQIGTYGANTTNVQVQCEESSTGTGNWTVIPNMVVSAITASHGTYTVKGLRSLQYARINAVSVSGTTPSVGIAANIIAEKKFVGSPNSGVSRSPSS